MPCGTSGRSPPAPICRRRVPACRIITPAVIAPGKCGRCSVLVEETGAVVGQHYCRCVQLFMPTARRERRARPDTATVLLRAARHVVGDATGPGPLSLPMQRQPYDQTHICMQPFVSSQSSQDTQGRGGTRALSDLVCWGWLISISSGQHTLGTFLREIFAANWVGICICQVIYCTKQLLSGDAQSTRLCPGHIRLLRSCGQLPTYKAEAWRLRAHATPHSAIALAAPEGQGGTRSSSARISEPRYRYRSHAHLAHVLT